MSRAAERDATARKARPASGEPVEDLPRIAPIWFRIFAAYTRRYVRKHFHALRLARANRPTVPHDVPVIVYLNHPSWWDPLVALRLAQALFPERSHYGPIEDASLSRYRIFSKIGFFGIEKDTARGARKFLRVSQALLSRPGATLWVTPEGRFTDPRERPLVLRRGIGLLPHGG